MNADAKNATEVALRIPTAVFLLWLVYRRWVQRKPLPAFVRVPLRLIIIVATAGLLDI